MMRKLFPLVLGLLGLCFGASAGYVLRTPVHQDALMQKDGLTTAPLKDYAKLANQFIIPVLANGKVAALMILSLSLEVNAGTTFDVDAAEPKLRDVFLQVLFAHANSGGFDGPYTDAVNLVVLRTALLEAAKSVLGAKVTDVLITDIMRRDG